MTSPQKVNVASVMRKYMDMSDKAVECAFSHGQVFLDGRCLGCSERVFVYDEVRGQMLHIGTRDRKYRQVQLGSRPAPAQLQLDNYAQEGS